MSMPTASWRRTGSSLTRSTRQHPKGQEILEAVKAEALDALGYFLKPSELFSVVAKRGAQKGAFILGDLKTILSNIERSTMGADSEGDFDHLFEDLDLTSTKRMRLR